MYRAMSISMPWLQLYKAILRYGIVVLLTVFSSCVAFYPTARLERDRAGELHIVYPSTKTSGLHTACNAERCAVLFYVRGYISVSFPPPGAIVDDRLMLYLAVTDAKRQPLEGTQRRIDDFARAESGLTGDGYGIFAYRDGFLVVYRINRSFYLGTFDADGNPLIRRRHFYTAQEQIGEPGRIMDVRMVNDRLFLFFVQPPDDLYSGGWQLCGVNYDVGTQTTAEFTNMISRQEGWYNAHRMVASFYEGEALIVWSEVDTSLNHQRFRYYYAMWNEKGGSEERAMLLPAEPQCNGDIEARQTADLTSIRIRCGSRSYDQTFRRGRPVGGLQEAGD